MSLLPQPTAMAALHGTGGEEVSGANLGSAHTGESLPGTGEDGSRLSNPLHVIGMGGEGGYQDETRNSTGVALGESLGDGPSHRVTHDIYRPDADTVENSVDDVGGILDSISL